MCFAFFVFLQVPDWFLVLACCFMGGAALHHYSILDGGAFQISFFRVVQPVSLFENRVCF